MREPWNILFLTSLFLSTAFAESVQPRSSHESQLLYDFSNRILKPDEVILLTVPTEFQGRVMESLSFSHRQNPQTNQGGGKIIYDPITGSEIMERDTIPGITSIQIFSQVNSGPSWRFWGGPSSGRYGGKYAEVSSTNEIETLYDWANLGSIDSETHQIEYGCPKIFGAKLVNVGTDPVVLSQVRIKLIPNTSTTNVIEYSFSPTTKIIPPCSMGAGITGRGTQPGSYYKNAIALSPTFAQGNYPAGVTFNPKLNALQVQLPAKKRIKYVSLSIGDQRDDQKLNRDGGVGSKGAARVSISVATKTHDDHLDNIRLFLNKENVPPAGFITGFSQENVDTSVASDVLLIQASFDQLYLMGIQIGVSD